MRSGHFCSVVIPVGEERQVRIAIHAFDGVTMFHLAVPQLVFGEVTRLGLAEGWDTVLAGDEFAALLFIHGIGAHGAVGLGG